MQTTSALYKQILADPQHVKEWRVTIGSSEYDKSSLVSIRRTGALYGKQLIGGACSGSLELTLWGVDSDDVPKMAEIRLEVRLVGDYDLQDRQIFYFIAGESAPPRAWVDYSDEIELVDGAYRLAGDIVTVEFDRSNPNAVNAAAGHYFSIRGASGDTGCYLAPSGATVKITTVVSARKTIWSFPGRSIEPQRSEWLPMGTYWVDRRKDDQEDGTLTLQCVDGMMFGEQDFYPPGSETTGWTNKTMREAAQMCATKMGIDLEDATQFRNAAPYVLTAPPVGYTVRQVLQGIAAAHGGNIIVTAGGELRLVPFVPTDSGVDIGQDAASLETGKQYEAFGNVVFTFDSADGEEVIVRYPTTEASGATMEAPLPGVTDSGYAATIAQNVLAALGSYRYAPYKAQDALLDPAVELGDGVTINGLYSVVAASDEVCDELYSATVGAESFEEVKNEFVFQPSIEKTVARRIAQSSASLKIDIDAIIAQVTDGQGNYTALTLRSDGLHIGNAQGTVTIGSGSINIPQGAISFGDGTLNTALQMAYNNSGDDNPGYIHSTYISQTKVISPHIYGGDLYATGQGNTSGTNPAFYMSDGVTGSGGNTQPNAPRGWLCYDKNGAGTTQEAQNRVFLHSVSGVALKLDAGGNMSLEANDSIYLMSYLKLRSGINYGSAAQRRAITPENGQIFFEIS